MVKSVRIIETCRNYERVFAALFCLDKFVSDRYFYSRKEDVPLRLIKKLIGVDASSLFDSYVTSMVKAYVRSKRQLVINMRGLEAIKEKIKGFVTEHEMQRIDTMDNDWDSSGISLSRTNLVSCDIISIFPNANDILIRAGHKNATYPFDMYYFATSIIKAPSWKSIKIQQALKDKHNFGKSWIAKLWHSSKSRLIQRYKQHHLEISFDKYEIRNNGHEWCYEYFKVDRV